MIRNMLALLLVTVMTACTTVPAGKVGVWTKWGATQDKVFVEGTYTLDPISSDMWLMDTRIQKFATQATASSRDLQVVSTKVVVNYRIDPEKAIDIFKEVGPGDAIQVNILDPAIAEAMKTATAKYNAEELITKRPLVKADMVEFISATMAKVHVEVTELSITDFQFDTQFQEAVEAKQIAEQSALQAENDLTRIEVEARQQVVQAQARADARLAEATAEAKAQRLLRKEITPELIRYEAIQKWDGTMPKFVGSGDSPFIMDAR